MKHTVKYLLFIVALLLVTLPSATSFQVVGTLYAGDVLLGALAIFGVGALMRSARSLGTTCFVWLLLFYPVIAALLDVANDIAFTDLFRGGARNAVIVSAIIATQLLIERVGLRLTVWFISGFVMSQSVVGVLLDPDLLENPYYIVKYLWGDYLVFPLLLLLRNSQRAAAVLMVGVGIADIIVFDCRGSGALFFLSGVLVGYRSILTKNSRQTMALFVLVVSAAIILLLGNVFYNEMRNERRDRWELSGSMRSDIALDAASTFMDNIMTGKGSWVHTYSFVDESNPDLFLGTHSTILLWAVEYGLLGFLVSIGCLFVIVKAFWNLFTFKNNLWAYRWEGVVPHLLMMLFVGGYILFMSPPNSNVRFLFGFSVGLALYVLNKSNELATSKNLIRANSPIESTNRYSTVISERICS